MQVELGEASLRTRGSMVMANSATGLVYVWHGAKSLRHSRQIAAATADALKRLTPPEMGFTAVSWPLIGNLTISDTVCTL